MTKKKDPKQKKKYEKPKLKTEKILEAALGITCDGTTQAGRKVDVPSGCTSGKLLT